MNIQFGILLGLVSMLGWGVSDFLGAYISRKTTPLKAFTLTRLFGTAALLILSILFFQSAGLSLFTISLALVTALLYVVASVSYYKGMTIGNVSIISPVASSYPALTVVLSVLLLGEKLTGLQEAAILTIIIGAILVPFKLSDFRKKKVKSISKGLKYAVIAAAGWGFMMIFIGVLASRLGWFMPILLMNFFGLGYLLSYSKAYRKDISLPKKSILIIIIFSAVLDVAASLSFSAGTTFAYIAIVATVSSVYPSITILLANFFFKEKLDADQWLGVLLVLFGLALLSI
jgi:drug/metabolite transporter (DMT)-like permease